MLPEIQNFKFIQGDSQIINLNFDSDITGWTIILTVKVSKKDSDNEAALQEKATIVSAADGMAKFVLSSTQTSNLIGGYKYDMQYKDSSGNIKTFLRGSIQFEQVVTERETI